MTKNELAELDSVIQAFGRATTETPVARPERTKAEDEVRDFLLALRRRYELQLKAIEDRRIVLSSGD